MSQGCLDFGSVSIRDGSVQLAIGVPSVSPEPSRVILVAGEGIEGFDLFLGIPKYGIG